MSEPSEDCIFCAIVAGEAPAHVAFSDDIAVGFLDTRPLFPGHVLLVPRVHVETLPELPCSPGAAAMPAPAATHPRR